MKKFIEKNKAIISILMATLTYFVFIRINIVKDFDILSWLIFLVIIIINLKTDITKNETIKESIIISGILSFLIVYGRITYAFLIEKDSVLRELFTLNSLLNFTGIFNFIYITMLNILPKLFNFKLNYKDSKINKAWKIFLISFSIILLGWLIYLLAFFPGTLTNDSISELTTIINDFATLSDHHPILHVIFISIPFNIGNKLFSNINYSVALVTITQMIIMASIFSSLIVFLYKRKINDFILLTITLIFSILPVYGFYSIVMWKDVIFAGTLLLLTMELIKILEKEKNNNLKLKNLKCFILISLLCVFFRNNAIYIYIILAIILLIIKRKYYKTFTVAFAIIFGVYFIVKGPIFTYFNITKSASAEYIGIPLQQIGRMAFKNVKFTKEEEELLNKLMPIEEMANAYDPAISDGIKFNENYNSQVFDENKKEYLMLWLKLIVKHPTVAIEAYSMSTLGYWYPNVEYWSAATIIDENEFSITEDSKLPSKFKECLKLLESKRIPLINIEWSVALYFWIIVLFAIVSYKKNKIDGLIPYIPMFGLWVTMMLASPVFGEFRYIYGAVTTMPLLIVAPYLIKKKEVKNER